ncbi:MAG TPA: GNAT family N-acetyltransferase [Nevskiales bacterium]|nr:GNAT family N-acetyltransferase [Nevskiales bacterium]
MNLRFRPAEPRDAELAVPLIYSAGPEGFEYVFTQGRRNARDFLGYAFTDGAGLFGCRNHRVAEYDGRVVGIGAFYSGADYAALSRDTLRQLLRFYRLACLPVLRRAMQTTRWMPPPGRRTLYVANLGVAPAHRGRGIGAGLLREQMQHARGAGLARLALDVAETNPAAQRLYERLGLRVVRESAAGLRRNGIALPAVRRMELLL